MAVFGISKTTLKVLRSKDDNKTIFKTAELLSDSKNMELLGDFSVLTDMRMLFFITRAKTLMAKVEKGHLIESIVEEFEEGGEFDVDTLVATVKGFSMESTKLKFKALRDNGYFHFIVCLINYIKTGKRARDCYRTYILNNWFNGSDDSDSEYDSDEDEYVKSDRDGPDDIDYNGALVVAPVENVAGGAGGNDEFDDDPQALALTGQDVQDIVAYSMAIGSRLGTCPDYGRNMTPEQMRRVVAYAFNGSGPRNTLSLASAPNTIEGGEEGSDNTSIVLSNNHVEELD